MDLERSLGHILRHGKVLLPSVSLGTRIGVHCFLFLVSFQNADVCRVSVFGLDHLVLQRRPRRRPSGGVFPGLESAATAHLQASGSHLIKRLITTQASNSATRNRSGSRPFRVVCGFPKWGYAQECGVRERPCSGSESALLSHEANISMGAPDRHRFILGRC